MKNKYRNVVLINGKRKVAVVSVFFFQAEDGIRDWSVTGVQTCALPIYHWNHPFLNREPLEPSVPKQKNIGTTHF